MPVFPDLQGKVAIATGGSGGIGVETCLALAKSGVKVAISRPRGCSPRSGAGAQAASP